MNNANIDKIIEKYQGQPGSLIQALVEIQHANHWLPQEVLAKVSWALNVPLSQVQHAATFHKALSVGPQTRHEIHVCNGTGCHVRGAVRVADAVENAAGIRPGETSPDARLGFKTVTCMGACQSGPLLAVDGKRHARITPTQAEQLVKGLD